MLLFLLLAAWVTAASNASNTVIEGTDNHDRAESSSTFQDEAGWQLISASKSGTRVRTYMKPYPGTKLVAFRGIAILDAHISQAMGLFCDFKLAFQWVDMLESIQALTVTAPNATHASSTASSPSPSSPPHFMDCRPDMSVDVVHQVVKLPWPLSKREIVLERRWEYVEPTALDGRHGEAVVGVGNGNINSKGDKGGADAVEQRDDGLRYGVGGAVTVHYHSVLDERAPLPQSSAVVRAESPHTLWRFQAVRPLGDTNSTLGDLNAANIGMLQGQGQDGRAISGCDSDSDSSSSCQQSDTATCIADDGGSAVDSAGDSADDSAGRQTRTAHPYYPLTRVEVQVIVDSKGSIPIWLINQVQRRWPLTALGAFDKLVKGDLDLHRRSGNDSGSGNKVGGDSSEGAVRTFLPVAHW